MPVSPRIVVRHLCASLALIALYTVTANAQPTPNTQNPTPFPALPQPIQVPVPTSPAPYLPFPTLPAVPLDEANNGIGIAQKMTRERGYQARMLWIDATANLDRVNTAEKIAALFARIKASGFNTVVYEVKPIIGLTTYPSKYAPKLTEWVKIGRTQTMLLEFDPLREMTAQAKAQGISLLVNFNAFSEGHREYPGKGLGEAYPKWQTILYEPDLLLRREGNGSPTYPLSERANLPARDPNTLVVYTDLTKWKADPSAVIAIVDRTRTVIALLSGAAVGTMNVRLPDGGAAIIGQGEAASDFLRRNAIPGLRLILDNSPKYIPIVEQLGRQIPVMTNPHNPDVRQRLLNVVNEVVTNYAVDGITLDDRLRYAALNADFSDAARREFEAFVGKPLKWPDDVFRYNVAFPSLDRNEVPGPYYDAWLVFRAVTMRNFLAEVVRSVKTVNPDMTVATYVGSWYPDYPDIGANWAADDLSAGFRFLNDSYKKAGWAGIVDFVTTGCYYDTASMQEATGIGVNIGDTVEAAGQFSNRAVNDQSFVYAALQLDKFKGRPDALKRCLQAAGATTQGIMVFDLSHDIEPFWPVFAEAFAKPAAAPHLVPGLLAELRTERDRQKASNIPVPPIILYRGTSGTGF